MGALPLRKARLQRVSQKSGLKDGYLQSIFTLALSAVRVNRCGWEPVVEEEVINEVGSLLALDKDQSTTWRHGD